MSDNLDRAMDDLLWAAECWTPPGPYKSLVGREPLPTEPGGWYHTKILREIDWQNRVEI